VSEQVETRLEAGAELQDESARQDCEWCGSSFGDFATESEVDGMCYDCYRDKFEFDCCRCQESEHVDHQHIFVVVFDEDEAGVPGGIYEVVRHPYFTQGLIGGGWLHEWAVRKIRGPVDFQEPGGYPVGHLCRKCTKALKLRQSAQGRKLRADIAKKKARVPQ